MWFLFWFVVLTVVSIAFSYIVFFLMMRRPPRSTLDRSSAASDVYKRQVQNQANAALLKEEFLRASFSGAMAREIAGRLALRETEEAYICSMMRNLGRFLAQYYLAEEADEVRRVISSARLSEESASIRVLGMSYQELGIGVALSLIHI